MLNPCNSDIPVSEVPVVALGATKIPSPLPYGSMMVSYLWLDGPGMYIIP